MKLKECSPINRESNRHSFTVFCLSDLQRSEFSYPIVMECRSSPQINWGGSIRRTERDVRVECGVWRQSEDTSDRHRHCIEVKDKDRHSESHPDMTVIGFKEVRVV